MNKNTEIIQYIPFYPCSSGKEIWKIPENDKYKSCQIKSSNDSTLTTSISNICSKNTLAFSNTKNKSWEPYS